MTKEQPIIIFCAFTRRWAVEPWLKNLAATKHNPALTSLCFIVDCEEPHIRAALRKFGKANGYRKTIVVMNEYHHVNETHTAVRRHRIAEIHEQSKELIAACDGDIVVGLEDDTIFDRLGSFEKLTRWVVGSVGFVEGVQMGRWGVDMVGAWKADNVENPRRVETLLPPQDTNTVLDTITGGGWYCFATLKKLWLEAPYFSSPSHPWGPDVEFGLWLNRQGYKCLINWSIMLGHNDHGIVKYPDDSSVRLAKIVYNKSVINGKWERTDHVKARY